MGERVGLHFSTWKPVGFVLTEQGAWRRCLGSGEGRATLFPRSMPPAVPWRKRLAIIVLAGTLFGFVGLEGDWMQLGLSWDEEMEECCKVLRPLFQNNAS
mmetsp:Transcript_54826/g.111904  ORF Transcript_54826/g.111904 Transcript_54826/m.111904 type:complete len:100 (+) Transcript_54826:246-545(+)